MSSILPVAGFHYGVPYEEYAAWDAINYSRLKPIRDTASKCKYAMENPKKPTQAMILGSAFHVAVLEPARFEQLFYICPPCDRRTAEGKEIYAKAEREAAGKLIIRSGIKEDESILGEVQSLRGMATAVHGSKAAQLFIHGQGQNEVSAVWQDPKTGLMCKARLDRYIPSLAQLDGTPSVVEFKKTRSAAPWNFGKDIDSMGYAAQAGGYSKAVEVITGKTPLHVFVAVESEPPYDLAVYTLNTRSLQTGALQYSQMLDRYSACFKSGIWPGYPDRIEPIDLPEYAHERNYENNR